MKKSFFMVLVLVVLAAIACFSGCKSSVVPPGTAVIKITTEGHEIITQGKYTAWGRDKIYFVDTKLNSFTEKMQILCDDDVNMLVDVKWIGSFDISDKAKIKVIKEKVPASKSTLDGVSGYCLDLSKFYHTAMADILRNASRSTVSPYTTDAVPKNRKIIESEIRKLVITRLIKLNYPVATSDVLVSNLDFDPEQTKQRQAIKNAELADKLKAAEAKARVAQAKRNAEIAIEEGKAKIQTAKAEAAANKIINDSLTDKILIIKQYEAFKTMASGPNNEAMIIPYQAIIPENMNAFLNRQSFRGTKK